MRKKLALAFGAALLLAVGLAAADGMHEHMAMHGPGMMAGDMSAMIDHLAKALDLTAEQKAAVEQIHKETMAKAQPLLADHHQKMEAVEELLSASNPDPAQVGERVIAAHAVMEQIKALHEEAHAKVAALLTPEQAAKFKTLQEMHHHGPMDGPPGS
jgi:Spy/CpxP family protein refolding chaperone